jgi:hypothetical protein
MAFCRFPSMTTSHTDCCNAVSSGDARAPYPQLSSHLQCDFPLVPSHQPAASASLHEVEHGGLTSLKLTPNAHRQTDRQTDRQTGRQTDRQAGRQTDRQTDRQAHPHTRQHGRLSISLQIQRDTLPEMHQHTYCGTHTGMKSLHSAVSTSRTLSTLHSSHTTERSLRLAHEIGFSAQQVLCHITTQGRLTTCSG